MIQECSATESRSRAGRTPYSHMPLLELARSIASESDRMALRELHENRRLFHYRQEGSLRMATFLLRLKESRPARKWIGANGMALDHAYDLTLDKFANLPSDGAEEHAARETHGPDCRYYYRAFYNHVVANLPQRKEQGSQIKAEQMAVAKLQHMVVRHFYLSCLESRRRAQNLVRRYFWQKNGAALGLWMPSMLTGSRCRQWLEANVPDYDPKRVGERERVQDIVNRLLPRPRKLPLHTVNGGAESIAAPADSLSSMIEAEISVHGLAQTVAEEKAETIEHQRPAIRALGKERLRELVVAVFEHVVNGEACAKDLTDVFGISQATFSRFAGSRWSRGRGSVVDREPPDLYRNTARILAHHSGFVEAADRAGLLEGASFVCEPPHSSNLPR